MLDSAPTAPEILREVFGGIATLVYEASGIEIPRKHLRFQAYRTPRGGIRLARGVGPEPRGGRREDPPAGPGRPSRSGKGREEVHCDVGVPRRP
jgi:hypothetical protein